MVAMFFWVTVVIMGRMIIMEFAGVND